MRILHDSHTHTVYSDGIGEIGENVEAAERKGVALLGITDHSPYLSEGIFKRYLREIRRWNEEADIEVLAGIEGDITPNGVNVPDFMAKKLDFVIASVHEWVNDPGQYVELVKIALMDETVSIIGHFGASFSYVGHPSVEDIEEILQLAEAHGKAFEISSRYRVPDVEFIKECVKRGIKLTFASDAHHPNAVGNVSWSVKVFKKAGGTLEDLLFGEFL